MTGKKSQNPITQAPRKSQTPMTNGRGETEPISFEI
jgi:hypothetical protein